MWRTVQTGRLLAAVIDFDRGHQWGLPLFCIPSQSFLHCFNSSATPHAVPTAPPRNSVHNGLSQYPQSKPQLQIHLYSYVHQIGRAHV